MAMPAIHRARERDLDLDLDFEARAEHVIGFDRQVVLEQAVYAELSALARTAPGKSRARSGFRPLDPSGRPS
jgi:hypothetical protein